MVIPIDQCHQPLDLEAVSGDAEKTLLTQGFQLEEPHDAKAQRKGDSRSGQRSVSVQVFLKDKMSITFFVESVFRIVLRFTRRSQPKVGPSPLFKLFWNCWTCCDIRSAICAWQSLFCSKYRSIKLPTSPSLAINCNKTRVSSCDFLPNTLFSRSRIFLPVT